MAAVSEEGRRLYVSNCDRNVSDSMLYELFFQAGPIDNVCIKTGNTGNIGVISYKHLSSIPYALNIFEGTSLYNRELWLSVFNPFEGVEAEASRYSSLSGAYRHEDRPRRHMEPRSHHRVEPYDRHDRNYASHRRHDDRPRNDRPRDRGRYDDRRLDQRYGGSSRRY